MSELPRSDVPEQDTKHTRKVTSETRISADRSRRRESAGDGDGHPEPRRSAENLGRQEYGDQLRAKGPPIPESDQRSDPSPAVDKTRTQANATDSHSSEPDSPGRSFRHYQGEFKGQVLDLYTDGTHWASGERAEGDNVVGQAPDRSPADTSDLPPTGEQLLHLDNDKASRAERVRLEGYRSADDILNVTRTWSELGHDLLAKPPPTGHTEANTRPEISPVPYEGLNPSDTASALLVFSALTAEAIGKGVKHWHGRKGHEDGRER